MNQAVDNGLTIGGGVVLTKVPFTDTRGSIAVLLKELADSQPIRRDERAFPRPQYIALQACSPRIASRKQRISCGRTKR